MNNEITSEIRKYCKNIEFLSVRLPYTDEKRIKELIQEEIDGLQKLVNESIEK